MGDSDDNKSSGGNALIMGHNGLLYQMPQKLSTTVNRTFDRQYAQRSQYNEGQTIVFDLNTGTSYMDPANAMLTFNLAIAFTAGTGDVSFGSGAGACSVIEEIRIISKNGAELDRIQNANILAKIMSDWTYDPVGLNYLQMAGKDFTYQDPVVDRKWVIPLRLLSGFFRPTVKDMLIPAGLASGLRIEITLARAARVLHRVAGTGTGLSFSVQDPEILCMLHDLNDPTQAVLMAESASNGLEYTFPSYFATTLNTEQTSINEQVKKAVSQCTRVFSTAFNVSGANSVTLENRDGFETITADDLGSYQYRVGSSYYPKNSISNSVEAWYVTSATFGKNKSTDMPCSVNLEGYSVGNKFLIGAPLQTHDRFNLSGLPINNSSVLELRLGLNNGAGLTRQLVVFMEYVSVSRTFINKTSIKI